MQNATAGLRNALADAARIYRVTRTHRVSVQSHERNNATTALKFPRDGERR